MMLFLPLVCIAIAAACFAGSAYRKGNTKRAVSLASLTIAIIVIVAVLIVALSHFGEAPRD